MGRLLVVIIWIIPPIPHSAPVRLSTIFIGEPRSYLEFPNRMIATEVDSKDSPGLVLKCLESNHFGGSHEDYIIETSHAILVRCILFLAIL